MMKTWQKVVGGVAALSAVGAVSVLGAAAGLYLSATRSYARSRQQSKERAISENTAADNVWYLRHNPVEWTQTSQDGLCLRASWIAADQPTTKVAILAHGRSRSGTDDSLGAPFMTGVTQVLMPDARAHGESDGHTIGYGWTDRHDYQGWINQVIAQNGNDSQIVMLGISMGAATVMATAGRTCRPTSRPSSLTRATRLSWARPVSDAARISRADPANASDCRPVFPVEVITAWRTATLPGS